MAEQRNAAVRLRTALSRLIAAADGPIPPAASPSSSASDPIPAAPKARRSNADVDDLVQHFRIVAARRSGEGRGVLPYRNMRASRMFRTRARRAVVPTSFIRSDISYPDPWWTAGEVTHLELAASHGTADPIETVIDLTLLDGRVVQQVRSEVTSAGERRKEFVARFEDGSVVRFGEIAHKLLPLAGADLLPNAGPVIVTEGAKAATALRVRGFPALGTLTGALGTPPLKALEILRGRDVILWPDNDVVGVRHMQRVAQRIAEIGPKSLRIARWVGAPRKADAADFQGDDDELARLIGAATEWSERTPVGGRGSVRVNPGRAAMRLTLDTDDRPLG